MMKWPEVRVRKVRFEFFLLRALSNLEKIYCNDKIQVAVASPLQHVSPRCVPGSDEEEEKKGEEAWSSGRMFMEEFDAPFSCRLSLKDFDRLILDLDRELAKQINICL